MKDYGWKSVTVRRALLDRIRAEAPEANLSRLVTAAVTERLDRMRAERECALRFSALADRAHSGS